MWPLQGWPGLRQTSVFVFSAFCWFCGCSLTKENHPHDKNQTRKPVCLAITLTGRRGTFDLSTFGIRFQLLIAVSNPTIPWNAKNLTAWHIILKNLRKRLLEVGFLYHVLLLLFWLCFSRMSPSVPTCQRHFSTSADSSSTTSTRKYHQAFLKCILPFEKSNVASLFQYLFNT